MPQAIAKIGDTVVAESDNTVFVEGNHYFPPSDVTMELLTQTDHHTTCHWKGEADYFTITVDGEKYENAGWTYRSPITDQAKGLKDMIAFYNTIVTVETK